MSKEENTNCATTDILSDFSHIESGVALEEFVTKMKASKSLEGNLAPTFVNELIKFSAEQSAYWNAKWLFSSATNPNIIAKKEKEGWENLWERWLVILTEKAPEIKEDMTNLKHHISLQYILRRRLVYNKERIFRQTISTTMSNLSFFFNHIGIKQISTSLYSISLYPKGTVARP